MIRELENGSLYMEFVRSFADDPVFSDPLLLNEKQVQKNLLETDRSPDKHMYGIFENNQIIGLFVFYVIEDEKYMEMLVGLSRLGKAYDEMFDRQYKELQDAIKNDVTGEGFVKDMFDEELGNNEYGYTRSLTDTLMAVGLAYKDIVENENLKNGLNLALKRYEEKEEEQEV